MNRWLSWVFASVDTSKPAICGRAKSGHFRVAETCEGLPRCFFLAPSRVAPTSGYLTSSGARLRGPVAKSPRSTAAIRSWPATTEQW